MMFKSPLEALRFHVSGAIARGEGVAIAGIPAKHRLSFCERIRRRDGAKTHFIAFNGGALQRVSESEFRITKGDCDLSCFQTVSDAKATRHYCEGER